MSIVVIGPNMEILSVNKTTSEMFPDVDFDKKPICYKTFNASDSVQPCSYCAAIKTFQDGKVHETITDTPTPHGIRNFRIITSPAKDSAGKVTSVIEMAIDITKRNQAEEALQRSEKSLEAAQEMAKLGSWELDPATQTGLWSKEMFRIFNLDHTQRVPILSEFMELIHHEDRENLMAAHTDVVQTGKTTNIEYRTNPERGPVRVIQTNIHAVQNVEGKVVQLTGTIQDVTERKKLEKSLMESEKRLKTIINTEPHCVKLLNADGTLIEMNPAGLAMIEAESLDQVKGASLYSLLAPDHVTAFQSYVKKIFSGGSDTIEFEIIGLKGTHRWLSAHSVPFRNSKGEITALLGITRDITEQRKLEDQFRQAQKMEAIGQLAGGISHDFNNLLSTILGYTSLALMKMKETDPLRTNLDHVLEASKKASVLIQSLLAFSRKQIVQLSIIDINELIEKFEKFLIRVLREDIEFKTIFSDSPQGGLMVMVDSGQIEQVLMNLVTNARDAMPEGGRLTIKTELFEIDENFIETHGFGKPGSYAMISVSDTGSGIDEETRKKIFEPFFTTKEVGRGTGLGLAMVYGTIKKHDGYIKVYSETGKGTTFRIYLPIATAESEKESINTNETVPIQRGAETILIAEDDATLRKLTTKVLENYGYTTIEAEDGEDVIRKYSENKDRISLVILDAIMPKKNGKEAYEEMKKLRPDIKAIFVSGYTADIFGTNGVLDKKISFISKPFSPIELARKIRELLDK